MSSPAARGRCWRRRHGLDVTNILLAARPGEIPSAEEIAALPADVITLAHGTNCWTRIPFSTGMFRRAWSRFHHRAPGAP